MGPIWREAVLSQGEYTAWQVQAARISGQDMVHWTILCKRSRKEFAQNHENELSQNWDQTDNFLAESVIYGKWVASELYTVLAKQDLLVKK